MTPGIDGRAEPATAAAVAYHERTKHHFQRYARALGYLDWDTQPDPFRRFADAELRSLPLPASGNARPYHDLFAPETVPPAALSCESVSLFFRYSLSLTAWKQGGDATWPLRANPSSGNLHPTEGYAILPALPGLSDAPGVYHYTPREHALEKRAEPKFALPPGAFLVGLSSIHWREAWKYGERAFRYCQHDVGHALAGLRIAAAALGWKLALLDGTSDASIARLFGLDREEDFAGAEREEPELLALVSLGEIPSALPALEADRWRGRASLLSPGGRVEWPAIDQVAEATRRPESPAIAEDFSNFPARDEAVDGREITAEKVILGRRSAVSMDGTTSIGRDAFFRMLARLLPAPDRRAMPWDAIAWRPRIHLGLFIHRVDGLEPGLYALVRDPARTDALRSAMSPAFPWQSVPGCPPLFLLRAGDCRALAARLSCGQEIAADGAFSLAMFADFTESLRTHGAAFYKNLFWEAGMVGQVLYLEAEAAGIRATGIGCFFDNPVHAAFGISGSDWQSLYHFTVGGPIEDKRLSTLPAYG